MKTHYTPKKEKYHIGFEYEFSEENGETWNNAVIKEGTQIDDIHREYRDCRVYQLRVKHLDTKDIKDEDWKDATQTKNALVFHNGERLLIFYLKTRRICITHKVGGLKEVGKEEPLNNLFSGTINNKSELKRVLTQIGIKQTK